MSDTPQPHILVVDDDPAVRDLMAAYLGENEFRVTTAASGAEMRAAMAARVVDLVLLDLRLRGEDGLKLARELREQSAVPIVVVSGKLEEADRVMALELGADDYVTKPFSSRELLARIRTVLRRFQATRATTGRQAGVRAYRFGGWELNVGTRRLLSPGGEQVELSNGEFSLLSAFLAAPGVVLSRDQLLESSRLYDDVYDRSVDVQILRLRRKIEEEPSQPRLILTERGRGYVFTATVERVDLLPG